MKLVQYAGIAIVALCLLVLAGVYVQQKFFPFDKSVKTASVEKQPEIEVKQEEAVAQVDSKNGDTAYIYALSDEKISQAIEEGKRDELGDFFHVPVKSSTIDDGVVESVSLATPFHVTANHSNFMYTKKGITISFEEAKRGYDNLIKKEALAFYIGFEEDNKLLYEVKIRQNGEVIGDEDSDRAEGDQTKLIYVPLKKIDFTKPATITITDKGDSSKTAEYEVVFADYVR